MRRTEIFIAACTFLLIGLVGCNNQGGDGAVVSPPTNHSVTGDGWLVDNTSNTEVGVTLQLDEEGNADVLLELTAEQTREPTRDMLAHSNDAVTGDGCFEGRLPD